MRHKGIRCILHLVDQISPVNYGIWHAAIAMAGVHKQQGIESWLLAPENPHPFPKEKFPDVEVYRLPADPRSDWLKFLEQFPKEHTLIVSHGCWQWPTKLAAIGKNLGYSWIYTPHGMLEPWSMQQKWWKKKLYFLLIEGRLAQKADWVRAVGKPESENLRKLFPKVNHVPNGIYDQDLQAPEGKPEPPVFLYLARLHHKKNPVLLAQAWISIPNEERKGSELWIAGTDDGEKARLEKLLSENPDKGIRFLGPCFGEAKADLLRKSSFYVLPSQSEGFPTSVVEAMGSGLIPLISEGCNFPEAFENQQAFLCPSTEAGIRKSLSKALQMPKSEREKRSERAFQFVKDRYLWSDIGMKFIRLVSEGH